MSLNKISSLTQNISKTTATRNNIINIDNSLYQNCKDLPYDLRKLVITNNINELIALNQKSLLQTACEMANREEWQCVLYGITTKATLVEKIDLLKKDPQY